MAHAVAILPADDLSIAKAFFVDVLGFRVQWEATTDGKTGLFGIERDGMTITIDAPMSGHGRQAVVSLRVHDAARRVPRHRPGRIRPDGRAHVSVAAASECRPR